jgi:hypothetical protein
MPSFLSVKEAAQLTGKSPSSIRRVIYPIIRDNEHPDRAQVQPSVDEVVQLRLKGENFAWRLSEELLRRKLLVEAEADKGSTVPPPKQATPADGEILGMLRRELEIKNQQISQQSQLIGRQMELINGLSERLREGNVLMGSLQQRLALPDGRASAAPSPAKTRRPAPAKPEKQRTMPTKTAKPKQGFLSRIFG